MPWISLKFAMQNLIYGQAVNQVLPERGQTYTIHFSFTCTLGIQDNHSIVSRPPRLEFPGALYHKAIFHAPADRERFLEQLHSQLNTRGRAIR